jgi:hypothetical protein
MDYLALMREGNTAAAERCLREYLASHPPLLDLLDIAMERITTFNHEHARAHGGRLHNACSAHQKLLIQTLERRLTSPDDNDQLPLFQNYLRFREWIDLVYLADQIVPINAEARDALQELVTDALVRNDAPLLGRTGSRMTDYYVTRLRHVLNAGLSYERCVRLRDAYQTVGGCPRLAERVHDYIVEHYLLPSSIAMHRRIHDTGLSDRHILRPRFLNSVP